MEEGGRREEGWRRGEGGGQLGEGGRFFFKAKAMNEVDDGRDCATPASIRHDADEPKCQKRPTKRPAGKQKRPTLTFYDLDMMMTSLSHLSLLLSHLSLLAHIYLSLLLHASR